MFTTCTSSDLLPAEPVILLGFPRNSVIREADPGPVPVYVTCEIAGVRRHARCADHHESEQNISLKQAGFPVCLPSKVLIDRGGCGSTADSAHRWCAEVTMSPVKTPGRIVRNTHYALA